MLGGALDLGFTVQEITSYLQEIGYWDTPEKLQRHAFVLSPCAYKLREEQSLLAAGKAIYAAVSNLEADLQRLAQQKRLTHAEAAFLRMAKNAS